MKLCHRVPLYYSEKNSLVSCETARIRICTNENFIKLRRGEEAVMMHRDFIFQTDCKQKSRPRGRSESALLQAWGCTIKINCAQQSISRWGANNEESATKQLHNFHADKNHCIAASFASVRCKGRTASLLKINLVFDQIYWLIQLAGRV